eukprot:CAMPEP_0181230484 /NCGR_PEP_ID=MMETSP1096-20121128/34499_1 /TAXON_ID=156174 ORGANISM="Chrysochromulina ericina, Strain CCMP281" /NCGR_SAMPLE_ID=MMETSP1096 /ASSEMBLY_ACC=CAM_ASM_000453 /LENGTH=138 /DNA_ID=CAMNT_0023324265 /DNA_START=120 /DNA_END=537 /DNA_ORIENTATION=-
MCDPTNVLLEQAQSECHSRRGNLAGVAIPGCAFPAVRFPAAQDVEAARARASAPSSSPLPIARWSLGRLLPLLGLSPPVGAAAARAAALAAGFRAAVFALAGASLAITTSISPPSSSLSSSSARALRLCCLGCTNDRP